MGRGGGGGGGKERGRERGRVREKDGGRACVYTYSIERWDTRQIFVSGGEERRRGGEGGGERFVCKHSWTRMRGGQLETLF